MQNAGQSEKALVSNFEKNKRTFRNTTLGNFLKIRKTFFVHFWRLLGLPYTISIRGVRISNQNFPMMYGCGDKKFLCEWTHTFL